MHREIDIRDRVKVKVKETRCMEDLENYKTLRNKATQLNSEVKATYYTNLILDNLVKSDKP